MNNYLVHLFTGVFGGSDSSPLLIPFLLPLLIPGVAYQVLKPILGSVDWMLPALMLFLIIIYPVCFRRIDKKTFVKALVTVAVIMVVFVFLRNGIMSQFISPKAAPSYMEGLGGERIGVADWFHSEDQQVLNIKAFSLLAIGLFTAIGYFKKKKTDVFASLTAFQLSLIMLIAGIFQFGVGIMIFAWWILLLVIALLIRKYQEKIFPAILE